MTGVANNRVVAACRDAGRIVQPNAALPRSAFHLLVVGELLVALLLWATMPRTLFPTPQEVLRAVPTLWRAGLGVELWRSASVNAEALALATFLSLSLTYLTVVPLTRPVGLLIAKLRFLGLVGLTFVFTVLLASGHALKVALLVFGISVFFVTGMTDVVACLPRERFDHARTLRMGEWRVVWEVVVIGTAAEAIDVLRQTAAIAWLMVTMVEGLVRSEGGIGALLLNQSKHLHLAEVFAIMGVILAFGLAQDAALAGLKRLVCPYASLGLERR